MTKDNSYTPSCVDCGTQNCKFKDRTYPEFCLTTGLDTEDLEWALERYDEGQNHDVMVASAEVEFEGYCRLTRVEEIMTFARKMGYKKIGIANCIGLINEARIFARILRANGFEAYSVICKWRECPNHPLVSLRNVKPSELPCATLSFRRACSTARIQT